MNSNYHIDASKISLEELRNDLLGRELIPSRKPLKVNLDKNLLALEEQGISTLEELVSILKNKNRIQELSRSSGVSEEYLILLRREANSYFPNPVPLNKLPGISPDAVERLATLGLMNTKKFFDYCVAIDDVEGLSKTTGISKQELQRMLGMADLIRVYGVGPVFSGMLYDIGIQSLEDFLGHSSEEIIEIYQDQTGKKADFSVSDLDFSQRMAQCLVSEM